VRWRRSILSVPLILVSISAQASILVKGEAKVRSGNDLTIKSVPFHLVTIDAFEPGQQCWGEASAVDCGARARKALQEIIAGGKVLCMSPGDGPGAEPARCFTRNGWAAQEMVRRGWALVRPDLTYQSEKKELCGLEAQAMRLKQGAWRYKFVLPYFFRGEKEKRPEQVSCGNAQVVLP